MKQLLVLLSLSILCLANSEVLQVILVDSSSSCYEETAATTSQEINNCSWLLNGHTIQVKTVSSQFPSSVVEVANILRDVRVNETTVIGMIGQVGNSFARSLLPVPQNMRIIQIIEPGGMMLDHDKDYHNLFTLPSLEEHISTALQFLPALNWTSVGIIYSGSDQFYARAEEVFVTLSNHSDIPISTKSFEYHNNSHELLKSIEQSSLKIFIVMLPKHQLCQFLSTVQRNGWTWPEYAWVVLNEYTLQNTTLDLCGSKIDTLEDIIFIRRLSNESSNRSTVDIPCNHTLYNTVSASLWALALAWNISTMNGNTSETIIKDYLTTNTFDSILVTSYTSETQTSITQIKSGVSIKVGSFNAKTQLELEINLETFGEIPTSYPGTIYAYELLTPQTTALTLTMVVLCILLTTIVLFLFVYYRKEQEIKATSFSISLCMFVGIYLLQAAGFSHYFGSGIIFKSTSKYFGCTFSTYCTTLGIDIVLATLLMKMLRLWRIFTLYGKTGKLWTDEVMLLFSGAIILIKVLILIIWAILDTHHAVDKVLTNSEGNTVLVEQCQSNNTILWAFLAYGYSGILGACLILVAIKTRKIKWNDFKDTKKICLLMYTLAYIVIQVGTLWGVLRVSHDFSTSKIIFGIGICVGSLSILGILFGPKIFPPIRRKFHTTRTPKDRTIDGRGNKPLVSQTTKTSLIYTDTI